VPAISSKISHVAGFRLATLASTQPHAVLNTNLQKRVYTTVSGTGRMPFVYAESGRHSPWLRLKVGNEVRFVDGGGGAVMYRGRKAGGKYAAGSFFRGLSRPWMGLHTIDTVRRDAARSKVWFEAEYTQGEEKAEVILTYDDNKLVYTINMETDVVEEISFVTKDGVQGQMVFEYLQNIDDIRSGFTEPGVGRYAAVAKTNGILWLFGLVNGE